MGHSKKGRILLIVSTTLVASITAIVVCGACSLCYLAFGPTSTNVKQTKFVPVKQGFSTDYYDLELLDSYWRTWDAPQVSLNPLSVKVARHEALYLEMKITNKLPQELALVCYTEDDAGNRFGASLGDLFIPVFAPRETRQGDMIFFVPNEFIISIT